MKEGKLLRLAAFVVISFILLNSVFAIALSNSYNADSKKTDKSSKGKKSVMVGNNAEKDIALNNGCTLDKKGYKIDSYLCDENIVNSLSLMQDYDVYALDTQANDISDAQKLQDLGFTGKGITIAILDTGYDYNHPDLASSYVGGYDFVNNDYDPFDDEGHGTNMAGIITSDGIDSLSKGISPDADIVSAKVLGSNGIGKTSYFVNAIYYVVDNYDVDVISISIGSTNTYTQQCVYNIAYNYVKDSIDYANQHGASVVIAAGNSGATGVSFPACVTGAFVVGGVNSDLSLGDYSNRGPLVDIYAPGTSIYTTDLGNTYVKRSGTSMSTPLVAGAIGLLKEMNPNLNYTDYQNALVSGAKEVYINPTIGHIKVLDVYSSAKIIDPLFDSNPSNLSLGYINTLSESYTSLTQTRFIINNTHSLPNAPECDENEKICHNKNFDNGSISIYKEKEMRSNKTNINPNSPFTNTQEKFYDLNIYDLNWSDNSNEDYFEVIVTSQTDDAFSQNITINKDQNHSEITLFARGYFDDVYYENVCYSISVRAYKDGNYVSSKEDINFCT